MPPAPDTKAIYDNRTETVRTGDGRFVRVKDLFKALATLNQVQLDRLIKRAGVRGAVGDPFVDSRSSVVKDLSDLCRSRPQFCLPILTTALELETAGSRFQGLLRDRAFGSASHQQVGEGQSRQDDQDDIRFDKTVGRFFWETREWKGEYQVFVTGDQRILTLSPGERFDSSEPYRICFVIVRTPDGRFWLRWPDHHRDIPAYYVDENEELVWFFPHPVDGEQLDFEELFPGYIYEVFGVQFQLPDIGTDYSTFADDHAEAFESWDPSEAAARRRAAEHAHARADAHAHGRDAPPPPASMSEEERWWAALELAPGQITSRKALSKHFRTLSLRYHPLKHLDAPEDDKERVAARYLEITVAYNALKERMGG